ncbi:MAG TPA: type II toxin-antitoxin system Phd/YefM family antitoxin [Phycisphaerae bacterium]|nr:type II toxin-antitoxin system Phd/YefM family antitoxin [Phycisphaerae bacterium]
MKASFVDLRKKSGQILRALERNERVTVLYRGRPKAVMHPVGAEGKGQAVKVREHPAYGLWADRDDLGDVAGHVRGLRKGRFNDR